MQQPTEIIFTVTLQDIRSAIARRLGEQAALSLSDADLQLAREEVVAALQHHLDIREYIDIGLDSWQITRHL